MNKENATMPARKLCFLTLLLLGACSDGTAAEGPSWFVASLSGEVAKEYEGTGDFSVGRDFEDSPRYFKMNSKGADTVVEERFWLRWPNERRPREGTYALVPHADPYGSPRGVTGVYSWDRGDNVTEPFRAELYVATGGTIEITRSTPEEVEGSIRFSGVQVTKWGPILPERDDPRYAPNPNAPKIEVSGSFRLKRYDPDNAVVRTTH
jgi:hypothetical protein